MSVREVSLERVFVRDHGDMRRWSFLTGGTPILLPRERGVVRIYGIVAGER